MSRVLLVCGGTGGHLAPGIALAQALDARGKRPLLLVSGKAVDARMLARYPRLEFRRGLGRPWAGGILGRLAFLGAGLAALADSLLLLLRRRPRSVVCFGGYLSLAPALVARLLGIPVHVHEANLVPGKAVRLLARVARTVHLPRGVSLAGLPFARLRTGGFPLRAEMGPRPRAEARAALGLPAEGRCLLVVGGSQGAAALTSWARAAWPALAASGCHLLCLTGPGGEEATLRDGAAIASFLPFCDRMPEAYGCADLAVSRSGAGTLAELAACGLPAVLVPYPASADDHQVANARARERVGAALLCAERDLPGLAPRVLALLADPGALAALREGQARAHADNGWDNLLDEVLRDLPAPREEVSR